MRDPDMRHRHLTIAVEAAPAPVVAEAAQRRANPAILPRLALVAAVLSLVPALAQAGAPAACPSEPLRVVRSRGGVVEYRGTVQGIPELCRVIRNGELGHYYWNVWRSDWPGAGLAYPVVRAVILGGTGARDAFVTRSVPGWQWEDTYTHEGTETLAIDGQAYDALRLAHERRGIEGNTYHSIITVWRDVTTGVTLKVQENQISGQSYRPDATWEAVRVEKLPQGSGSRSR